MLHQMKRLLPFAAVSIAMVACTNINNSDYKSSLDCGKSLSQSQTMKLDLVSQIIDDGNYYSALAHLEDDNSGSPRALWLLAEAQRKTGLLTEAYDSYRDLSLTCMTAFGHAGMAKILATRGDLDIAHQYMLKARRLAPTNSDIRNDYGFILLAMQDFKAAQREFMTALQLQPGHPVALRNMVMSLILDGDSRTAVRMAENNGIDETEFRVLIEKANHFAEPAVAKRAVIN